MAEIISITSGKGGVGKSTCTANLALGLALAGKKVVAIDFDIGLRNLDMILGLENRIVYDIIDVMDGKCRLNQALINDKRTKNMYFLPASQSRDKTALDLEKIRILLNDLKKDFEYILLDSPAGIEDGFKHAMYWATRALIVVTPEVSSIRDSDRVIGIMDAKSSVAREGGELPKHIIINRIRVDMVGRGDMLSNDDVHDMLGLEIIGLVPEDQSVISATNAGEPVIYGTSKAAQSYKNITRRILGESVPFQDLRAGGLFSQIKKLFS